MNYLAHVFLQRATPDLMVGGLLGDFVKGSIAQYPTGIRAGIRLHRDIDRFTDAHTVVRASCALISPGRRRFAGILVDVFYDHFLARHWQEYSELSIEQFTQAVYTTLGKDTSWYPERLQRILPYMVSQDWLAAYSEIDAVDLALCGIARRFQRFERAQVLKEGVQELQQNYAALERQFLEFFPELLDFVELAQHAIQLESVPTDKPAVPELKQCELK